MYIEFVPNRNSPPAVLLRESWWDKENKRSRKRTIANLSKLPSGVVAEFQACLQGGTARNLQDAFTITASLPHGHVAAVLGTVRKLDLEDIITPKRSHRRDLVVAMIAACILRPQARLTIAQCLSTLGTTSSLGTALGLNTADADELHAAMDWLVTHQDNIETRLIERHIPDESVGLWHWFSLKAEESRSELTTDNDLQDNKKGPLEIKLGLLSDREGRPLAVEMFDGNVAEPASVATAVRRLQDRLGLTRVVAVGNQGQRAENQIGDNIQPAELNWISSLNAQTINSLAANEALRPSLLHDLEFSEIYCEELFPGERLIVNQNQCAETVDGFHVLRTNLPQTVMSAAEIARSYKQQAQVKRTVDILNSLDQQSTARMRSQALLCALAGYVKWHMCAALRPILLDNDGDAPPSSVAPAKPTAKARRKTVSQRTDDNLSAPTFDDLLMHLSTLATMQVQPACESHAKFNMITTPTPLQDRAFQLLGIDIH